MSDSDFFILTRGFLFLLIFARVTGMLLFMPVIGGKELPQQIRFFGAIAFSLLIASIFWSTPMNLPDNILVGAVAVAAEFLIGLTFSAAMYFFFATLYMAGDYIGRLGGFSISTMFDPATGENVPTLSKFFFLAGVALFISLGGMESFLTGFIDSFQTLAPGQSVFSPKVTDMLVSLLGTSMILVIKIAAPVTVATLTVFLVIGILGRAIPQLNVMSLAFGLNSMLVLAVLFLGLGFSMRCFAQSMESLFQTIFAK